MTTRRLFEDVAFTRDDYEDWRAQVDGHEVVLRKCQNGGGTAVRWAVMLDPAKDRPGPAADGTYIGSWPKLQQAAKYGVKTARLGARS